MMAPLGAHQVIVFVWPVAAVDGLDRVRGGSKSGKWHRRLDFTRAEHKHAVAHEVSESKRPGGPVSMATGGVKFGDSVAGEAIVGGVDCTALLMSDRLLVVKESTPTEEDELHR
jgi:hypothetical protein